MWSDWLKKDPRARFVDWLGLPAAGMLANAPPEAKVAAVSMGVPWPAGDLIGLGADAMMYARNPETLTGGNLAMSFGSLLPGVMPLAGIIAGKGSRLADLDALAEAQRLEVLGRSEDEIWDATGWYKDLDGKWRYEIADPAPRDLVKTEERNWAPRRLDEVIEHPELFEAYPELAGTPMRFEDNPNGAMRARVTPINAIDARTGKWNPGQDEIVVNTRWTEETPEGVREWTPDAEELGRALLHETQHVTQGIEGFAMGGSIGEFVNKAEQVRAANKVAERDILKINAEMSRLAKLGDAKLPPAQEAQRVAMYDDLMRQRQQIVNRIQQNKPLEDPYEHYWRLLGETEARNVETRAGTGRTDRPMWSEDVPKGNQTVKNNRRGPKLATRQKAVIKRQGFSGPVAKEVGYWKTKSKAAMDQIPAAELRYIEDFNGNRFVWDSSEALHLEMAKKLHAYGDADFSDGFYAGVLAKDPQGDWQMIFDDKYDAGMID